MRTIVTTAHRPTNALRKKVEQISKDLAFPFEERSKRPIDKLHGGFGADVLVAAKERLEFYPLGKTEPFFFHPNSSAFRTKRPLDEDPLIEVSGLQAGDFFVDCTLGMASDAIVASQRVGEEGQVVGCESHKTIAYVVQHGLAEYEKMPHVTQAMKRIRVVHSAAVDFLAALPANSVDVVYMDPPYNTGKDTFIYNDNYRFTKAEVERLKNSISRVEKGVSLDDPSRHTKWINHIAPRLWAARTAWRLSFKSSDRCFDHCQMS